MEQVQPIRVGVLLEGTRHAAWVAATLADLVTDSSVAVVGVLQCEELRQEPESWLFQAYRQVDEHLFARDCRPDAFRLVDGSACCTDVPRMLLVSTTTDGAGIDGAALEDLRILDLDVLLSFGRTRLHGPVLSLPRRGVWAYTLITEATAIKRTVLDGTVCESQLMRLGHTPAEDQVLDRVVCAADPLSLRRSLNRVAWRTRLMARRVIQQGARKWAWPESDTPAPTGRPDDQTLGTLELATRLVHLAANYARKKVEEATNTARWALAVTVNATGGSPRLDGRPTYHVVPPLDRFWADPFPIEHDGRCFVFVEELEFSNPRGHISVIEIDERGPRGAATPVIKEPHHLSYPSVFRDGNDIFMTPESSEAGRIDLYRARRFPDEWEKVAVMMDGVSAADPTLFFDGDRWWMFVNLAVHGGPNCDECHLFSAAKPAGPWLPHPSNPIRSDVRRARPAGRLFRSAGRLYRPAQDCGPRYGFATAVQEVQRLSLTDYSEREVARIEPTWRPDGLATHTLNHATGLTVVDILLRG
jgi:hypothetical protein